MYRGRAYVVTKADGEPHFGAQRAGPEPVRSAALDCARRGGGVRPSGGGGRGKVVMLFVVTPPCNCNACATQLAIARGIPFGGPERAWATFRLVTCSSASCPCTFPRPPQVQVELFNPTLIVPESPTAEGYIALVQRAL